MNSIFSQSQISNTSIISVICVATFSFVFAVTVPANANAGVDSKTRDLLIAKLTQVYLNLAPADASKVPITMRLADLHAERARLDAMADLENGCQVCDAGQADRKKALNYYQEILPKVPSASIGKVLTQVGHLYEMTGNEKEAIQTYEKILNDPKSTQSPTAEADLSLAEIFFKRKDFAKARGHYAAVLANQASLSRGLSSYRMAWCDFNDGQTAAAISGLKKILTTPELSSRSTVQGVIQIDPQFQEEVSRDLATFMGHQSVTVDDAKSLYELSPESAKLSNVSYLAAELERLGQPNEAIALWRFVQDKQAKPAARLEGFVRLAQLEMEQKQTAPAAKDFDAALSLWTIIGASVSQGASGACRDQDCAELHARLRKFVTDWNRMEKKEPSGALFSAYESYTKTFPREADMQLWAGQVAQMQKRYPVAVSYDLNAAKLAGASAVTIEASLLQGVEAAELSKDKTLQTIAYNGYLDLSPTKKKALEVRYQKAQLVYEANDYAAAAAELRDVALSKQPGSNELKAQAAQLALDSLVLLKDDMKLEAWAKEFANAFPKDADDFLSISRQSILTQSAAKASKGDAASLDEAWITLNRFDLSAAKPADKAAYGKNRLVLAEKMGKFREAREAADALLRVPNLSIADQQYALSRKAWLAEMALDFDTALTTTRELTNSGLPLDQKAQKNLRLAMYAQLAAKDPKPYYAEFLKTSKDVDKNVAITAELVRGSKDPLKEIEKNKALLVMRPDILANLFLESFARTGSIDTARKACKVPLVAATPAGRILGRAVVLDESEKLAKKFELQQIDSSNQKKLAATLKGRVALLDQSEKQAAQAVESGDWTSELVTLDLLGRQSARFYQDVLALPVPPGLSDEDQSGYLRLLSQQAAPHQLKANDVTKKVNEFWENKNAIAQLNAAATSETGALRQVLIKEIQALARVAPPNEKAQLEAMVAAKEPNEEPVEGHPTLAAIEGARQAVREDPLSRPNLEALLRLEKKSGAAATVMVAYLENRLQTFGTSTAPSVPGALEKRENK